MEIFPRAWPYFRAIGDTGPVVRALDAFDVTDLDTPESQEALGATIQIAFQEGLHPRKGFELILKHHGLCRAITMFGAYPQGDGRNDSIRLLVRSLHGQIVENLSRAICGRRRKAAGKSFGCRAHRGARLALRKQRAIHRQLTHCACARIERGAGRHGDAETGCGDCRLCEPSRRDVPVLGRSSV